MLAGGLSDCARCDEPVFFDLDQLCAYVFFINSANRGRVTAGICLENNWKSLKWILIEFSGNVNNGPKNRFLHFGDVVNSKDQSPGPGALIMKLPVM